MTHANGRSNTEQQAGNRALQIGGSVGSGSIITAGAGVTIIVQQVPRWCLKLDISQVGLNDH